MSRETARFSLLIAAVILLLATLFLSFIALIFAWSGCLDYCRDEAGFWSLGRAGRLGLGLLSSALAALCMRFASEGRFRETAFAGLLAMAGASVVAASL